MNSLKVRSPVGLEGAKGAVPELNHLQLFVIKSVEIDAHSGMFIRALLSELGEEKSLAAFYQFMSRLEEQGMLEGWYETESIDGQTIKSRHYSATLEGKAQLKKVRMFYRPVVRTKRTVDAPHSVIDADR